MRSEEASGGRSGQAGQAPAAQGRGSKGGARAGLCWPRSACCVRPAVLTWRVVASGLAMPSRRMGMICKAAARAGWALEHNECTHWCTQVATKGSTHSR